MSETSEERAKRIGGIFCLHERPDKESLTAGLCTNCLAAEIRSAVSAAREPLERELLQLRERCASDPWWWAYAEYLDEGWCGPYASREEAEAEALATVSEDEEPPEFSFRQHSEREGAAEIERLTRELAAARENMERAEQYAIAWAHNAGWSTGHGDTLIDILREMRSDQEKQFARIKDKAREEERGRCKKDVCGYCNGRDNRLNPIPIKSPTGPWRHRTFREPTWDVGENCYATNIWHRETLAGEEEQ